MDPSPTPAPTAPPRAEPRPTELVAHGDRRVDPWYWLRDRDDPAVMALLRAENAYTAAATAPLEPLRTRLFDEIRGRILETDLSVPVRRGGWWYYQRTVEGLAYPIHVRLRVAPGADDLAPPPVGTGAPGDAPGEEVLLDENLLAEGHPYLQVANLEMSPGDGLLAYAADTTGDERYTLRIRDLGRGADLAEEIADTSYGVAWADDGTVFYTRADAAHRPHQLWRHVVGTPTDEDVLVHHEDDERFFLGVGTTKDRRYVLLELHSQVTSEVHALDTTTPSGRFEVVAPRRQGVEYGVEHHDGSFVILTNDGAEDFRLVSAPTASGGPDRWFEVLPERPGTRLLGFDVFARHLVTYERLEGDLRIRLHRLEGDRPFSAPLGDGRLLGADETPSASWGGPNPEFGQTVLRYEYSSLVTPRTVYALDLEAPPDAGEPHGGRRLLKRQPVLGGYDPDRYRSERLWATSADGTRVPVSIVRRRDVEPDGRAPCLVYGYGAYEHSVDPVFSSIRLSLLDRGVVCAIAHVRGGGELGRRWYEDGKLLAKHHSFEDFVACGAALVEAGWAAPDRLVARGASAGGLLMGASLNLAPELYRAVVAEVPFVDCLTTILDPTLPLTVIEWEEWGNPGADADVYAAMRAYSPYDNVAPRRYPPVLVTAGLEDPRVGYWEPAKWVQRLRAADGANRVLLKVELEAGHGGPTGRYDAWRDEAFVLAFLLAEVGLDAAPPDPAASPSP